MLKFRFNSQSWIIDIANRTKYNSFYNTSLNNELNFSVITWQKMIIEQAYAKINIGLNIIEKRQDGFHNIDTIMQTVSLYDEIHLEKAAGIYIYCSDSDIPANEYNTAYKAAVAFFKKAGLSPLETGVCISIEKNIPVQSGLGGGSSDAAAVLRGLNNLYCTNFGISILEELALVIGSDVPFCISGGTQRAEGKGEILTDLPLFNGFYAVIIMPDEVVNTAHAYSLYSKTGKSFHPNIDDIAGAISKRDLAKLGKAIGNTFEGLVFPKKQKIEKAKHDILDTGAPVALMTGSGAAVYGIYSSFEEANSAYFKLRKQYHSYLTETIRGIT